MNAAVGKGYVERMAKKLPEDQEWQLSVWADAYFSSVTPSHGEDLWRHVEIGQMMHTDAFVAGTAVKPLAAEYIHFPPEMQDRNLDWLVADTLCFAEVNATLVFFNKMITGKQAKPLGLRVASAAFSFLRWAIWLAIVVAAFAVSSWAGIAVLAVTGWVQFAKFRAATARAKLLHEMLGTYQALVSTTLSWSVLWDHMSVSRSLGAVWPPELYRLVELRIGK